jgi:large-conductance mechanosensitive channel
MGILQTLGVKATNTATSTPIDWTKAGIIIGAVFLFILVGTIVFMVVWNNYQKKRYNKKIEFAREVNGKVFLTSEDWAREINIPNTAVKVFILKNRGTFSPKLIYTIGDNRFLILVGKGGEWINTDLRYGADGVIEINDKLKPTRDYANENLKELIDRNWTNKNRNWLKDNIHIILFIAVCVLIIIALIINGVQQKKTRSANIEMSNNYKLASQSYAESQTAFIKFLEENFKTSGVTPATGGG